MTGRVCDTHQEQGPETLQQWRGGAGSTQVPAWNPPDAGDARRESGQEVAWPWDKQSAITAGEAETS